MVCAESVKPKFLGVTSYTWVVACCPKSVKGVFIESLWPNTRNSCRLSRLGLCTRWWSRGDGVSSSSSSSSPFHDLAFPNLCFALFPLRVFAFLIAEILLLLSFSVPWKKNKIKIGPIFLVASGVFVVPEFWLRFGRLAVQPRWCTPPKLLLQCKSFRGGGKLCVRVELKGVKEKDSNCYFVAIHNWFSVRQRQVHFWSYSRWSEFQEVKPGESFWCLFHLCLCAFSGMLSLLFLYIFFLRKKMRSFVCACLLSMFPFPRFCLSFPPLFAAFC